MQQCISIVNYEQSYVFPFSTIKKIKWNFEYLCNKSQIQFCYEMRFSDTNYAIFIM